MIALDTHTLLWWMFEPSRLSPPAYRATGEADRLGVPAIVFGEVALLARRKRIDLGMSTSAWMSEVLSLPRIEVLPITAEIAVEAEGLAMHGDPADRFIVATARLHQCALVTKDSAIRRGGLATIVW